MSTKQDFKPGDKIRDKRNTVRVSGWVNVYVGWIRFHETRRAADVKAYEGRIACVYVSGVEGKKPK